MSKKLLAVLLTAALVLTTLSTAFAAVVPTDVAGTDFLKAVSKLQSLNIMGGYPDGTFKPDQTITRREFAKIAVLSLGLGDAATISQGTTKFSDVAADDWASGYINVASAQGIITGYPDGTYKPDQTINYAEAITILAKALGYGPVLAGKTWPAAYIAKAADIGMTDGVVMAPTVGASRGNVAKLLSNTLDKNVVIIKSYDADGKPTYSDLDADTKSMIQKKLGLTPQAVGTTKDFWLTSSPLVQNSPTVDASVFSGLGSYSFVDGLNANDYLGLNVKVWLNSDNKVKLTEIANDASDIYSGIIEADGAKIKLVGKATSYDYKTGTDFTGYLNSTPATGAQILGAIGDNVKAKATVVLDSGRIKFINAYVADSTTIASPAPNGYTSYTFVVKDLKDGYLRAVKGTYVDKKIQDIKDDITKKTCRYDIFKNGAVATIDDVAAGDVVQISAGDTTKHQVWYVTSGDITGKLTNVAGTAPTYDLTVGDKTYKLGHDVTSSWNAGTDNTYGQYTQIGGVGQAIPLAGALKDAIGKDVTIKLNSAGQIAYLSTTASSTTYYYGVLASVTTGVPGADGNLNTVAVIYKKDGTKATYAFEKAANVAANPTAPTYSPTVAGFVAAQATINGQQMLGGDLVQYQLTSDGKIKDATMKRFSNMGTADLAGSTAYINPSDASGNRVGTSLVSSDTVIFDVYNVIYNGDPVKLLSYGTIKSKPHTYQIAADGAVAKYIVVNGGDNITNPNFIANDLAAGTNGVIVGFGTNGDGDYVQINANGTVTTYGISAPGKDLTNLMRNEDGVSGAVTKGYYLDYNVDSAGKISSVNYGYATLGGGGRVSVGTPGSPATGKNRSYAYLRSATFRVVSVDTANSVLKVNDLDSNNMNGPHTYYFSYKAADLNVYNAKDTDAIKGGLTIADVSVDDYVWVNVGVGDISNTQVDRVVLVKKDNIVAN